MSPNPPRPALLARARAILEPFATADGHTDLPLPGLCLYRFSAPTTFVKAATLGVTLGVVVQGAKRIRLGGVELDVHPEQLVVVTRETDLHSAVTAAPYLGVGVCFGPERVARALLALAEAGGDDGADETAPAFALPVEPELAGAIERLLAALADPLDRALLAPLVLDELLYRLLRSDAAAAVRGGVHAADAGRIVESMQYIRAHLEEKLTVERLARQAMMSPSHYAHRFRAVARTSPMRFLREVRLERARALLFADGARAGEVGARVGFESPAHFAREFKRRYGAAPSSFLRRAD